MPVEDEVWLPGSFTKNFSWGPERSGLKELYDSIREGFADSLEDVPRELFRERVQKRNRPDFIPINFFLFNKPIGGEAHLVVDELVFQALSLDHAPRFDKLALFALNFSFAGKWARQRRGQRYPARWAGAYVRDRYGSQLGWDFSKVSANDIERFLVNDSRYRAEGARKVSTNLYYLFRLGGLKDIHDRKIQRWWVDALFLALDRIIEDRKLDGRETREGEYAGLLSRSGFLEISGGGTLEKELAIQHLGTLYSACGGRERFSEESTKERMKLLLSEMDMYIANDERPRGAVHRTNPNILKSIPRACAMLAKHVGFDVIDPDEMANFDINDFVRRHTREALESLQKQGIEPNMTAEEVMRMTRDK